MQKKKKYINVHFYPIPFHTILVFPRMNWTGYLTPQLVSGLDSVPALLEKGRKLERVLKSDFERERERQPLPYFEKERTRAGRRTAYRFPTASFVLFPVSSHSTSFFYLVLHWLGGSALMEDKSVEFKNLCSREYFGHKRKVTWYFPLSTPSLVLSHGYSAVIYARAAIIQRISMSS